MNPFTKKRKETLKCPDICGGTVRVIDRADKNALVSPQKMDEGRASCCSECPSTPNAALLSSTQWLISIPLLAAQSCSLGSSCSRPSLSPYFLFYFFPPPGFGEAWMSLMGRQGPNLFTQISIIRRLCSMCPLSCLTRKETPSRYHVFAFIMALILRWKRL